MNIYCVRAPNVRGYDVYTAFVCYAHSEHEARRIHPENEVLNATPHIYNEERKAFTYHDGTEIFFSSWTDNIDSLAVTLLGRAPEGYVPERPIILTSFNAG